ncbi:MAG: hypothetical protein MUD12_00410 [Spirochaetes bacterium]|jgi:hypothetical protein|nr:hypothetical protein [Spirochaetota bacterium]
MRRKFIFVIIILITGCSDRTEVKSFETGSSLDEDGVVLEKKTDFSFKLTNGNNRFKDVFNSIYFSGDTVCFSLEINRRVERSCIRVWFAASGGKKIPAERIDINNISVCLMNHGSRISGFSLLGSLLEFFHGAILAKRFNPEPVSGDIPFTVIAEISDGKEKTILKKNGVIRIGFTNRE